MRLGVKWMQCELSRRLSISAAPELEYQKPGDDNEATDSFLPLQFMQRYYTLERVAH